MKAKEALRKKMRAARLSHAAALPESMRALVLNRPPQAIVDAVPTGAVVATYHAISGEAPAAGFARFFAERGHRIALPRLDEDGSMSFREHTDPFGESDLETGRHGIRQPSTDAPKLSPEILFVPLVAFSAAGDRLGQGGGHYDRWMDANPDAKTYGIAWDIQLVDEVPTQPHDRRLDAVVTPTRLYGHPA